MKVSTLTRGIASVAALALIAGCGASGTDDSMSGGSGDGYEVRFIGPLTGAGAPAGVAVSQGAQAAASAINANGGVDGQMIEVTLHDDLADPTKAVSILQEGLTGGNKPDLTISGISSNEALAMGPLLTRNKLVAMSNVVSPEMDDPEQFPYFFSTAIKPTETLEAASEFAKTLEDGGHVALIIQDDALAEAITPPFEQIFEDAGFQTSIHKFDPEALDVSPAFASAKQAGADIIYAEAVAAAVPRFFEGRMQASAEDIPVIGGVGLTTTPFPDFTTPEQRAGVYPVLPPLTEYIDPADRSEPLQALFDAVTPEQGELPVPIYAYAYGWDAVQIWAAAVEQAGSADPDEVAEAMTTLDVPADRQWLLWDKLYSDQSHFPTPTEDELVFKEIDSRKDTMFVPTGS